MLNSKIKLFKKSAGTQTGYLQRMIPGVTAIIKQPQNGGTLYPASNLTYLSHPEQFVMGAKLFPVTFLIKKIKFKNINLFGLCESAWLPWKPIVLFSRMGVYLQNQLYLICYLP